MEKYIKKLSITVALFITMIMLSSCMKKVDVSIDELENELTNVINKDRMQKGDNKSLRRYFGINANEIEDYILYIPKSNMDVDELLIVKVKDISQIDTIDEIIESRISTQIQNFSGYGVEQTKLLEDYEINIKDKYIFYTVCENAQELEDSYKDILKNK